MNWLSLCSRRRIAVLLWSRAALLIGLSSTAAAASARPNPAAACAAYDLHFLTLLDDYGLTGQGDPAALTNAAALIADARTACREGDFDKGLLIYESVKLAPFTATSFLQSILH
jgi:hypothetical protein